jgi:hypothetical protein
VVCLCTRRVPLDCDCGKARQEGGRREAREREEGGKRGGREKEKDEGSGRWGERASERANWGEPQGCEVRKLPVQEETATVVTVKCRNPQQTRLSRGARGRREEAAKLNGGWRRRNRRKRRKRKNEKGG